MTERNTLVVVGSAPCLEEDLARIPEIARRDLLAVGLDAVDRVLQRIAYLATYHPSEISSCREKRAAAGGNTDYKVISHERKEGVDIVIPFRSPSGSSSLLGCLAAIREGYTRIVLAGCPLDDKKYHVFRQGWQRHLDEYVGKVKSLSGWTKEFLGGPPDAWFD